MDSFGVLFGGAMIGLVTGALTFVVTGGNTLAAWLVGLAAGLALSWKMLTEFS